MSKVLSCWPPGKNLASQLIATLLRILKVCSKDFKFGRGNQLVKCIKAPSDASKSWKDEKCVNISYKKLEKTKMKIN